MYKRGNVYWCKITQPGQKPFYQSLGTNRKMAKAIEAKIRCEIFEGKFFDKQQGEHLTLSHLLDIYQERHARFHKKPESCQTDKYMGNVLIAYFGDRFLTEITPSLIEGYVEKRLADGRSPVTIHHELNLMRHAYSLAVKKWDLLKETPFVKVQLPTGDRKRVRYLKPEEETLLFDSLKENDWLRSVVIVARETGLRLSNVCNLTWSQTNLFEGFIEIEKTKNGKPVWIPLTDAAHAELTKWNKVRDLKMDRVFIVDGKAIHKDWVGLAFRRLCKRIGLQDFRFHDLRHDFCSRLVQAGQPLHVVAALAGHEDISTTQRYAHLSPETKRKAIEALNFAKARTGTK
ncbi:MAG: tyrosine-type recombinase/integrase [Candidatus Nitrohelix vancouverensis]|uniref:Tyrosine-type recombinase/integrase n=1 Tax=Candidatus Nitrohelix vancouverensis TaxID=2705534 RepID=A0A7T0C2J0_9BACT|nr:MAG: tyrosine-type recombinase/integrase [Candidatus Nitrohelix vancouverensis]